MRRPQALTLNNENNVKPIARTNAQLSPHSKLTAKLKTFERIPLVSEGPHTDNGVKVCRVSWTSWHEAQQ